MIDKRHKWEKISEDIFFDHYLCHVCKKEEKILNEMRAFPHTLKKYHKKMIDTIFKPNLLLTKLLE
jgi:transposase-like protein